MVKASRSTWVSRAPLTAKEIRHLQVLENLRFSVLSDPQCDFLGCPVQGQESDGSLPTQPILMIL